MIDFYNNYIKCLPQSIEDLIDSLIFVEKLEIRIEQSKKDETISEQELENEMKEWYK